jgi:hypothetical protein
MAVLLCEKKENWKDSAGWQQQLPLRRGKSGGDRNLASLA